MKLVAGLVALAIVVTILIALISALEDPQDKKRE